MTTIVGIGVTKRDVRQSHRVVQRLSLSAVMVLAYRDSGDVTESRYLIVFVDWEILGLPNPLHRFFAQDCDSGEDEKNCNEAVEGSRSCASDEHSCKDGRCIMVKL